MSRGFPDDDLPPSIILHVIVHTGNDPLSEKCFNSLLKKSFQLKNEVSFLIAERLDVAPGRSE